MVVKITCTVYILATDCLEVKTALHVVQMSNGRLTNAAVVNS